MQLLGIARAKTPGDATPQPSIPEFAAEACRDATHRTITHPFTTEYL